MAKINNKAVKTIAKLMEEGFATEKEILAMGIDEMLLLPGISVVVSGEKEEKKTSYQKVLPEYLNKMCEITLKEPLAALDIMFSAKGILVDMDEEWVMLEVEVKKKKVVKMFRIDNISSIKEIL